MHHLMHEDLARARMAQLTRTEHEHGIRRRSLRVALETRRREQQSRAG